ncbi:glycoprotein Xg isoform X9 [Acinonyx jubatus]|uniref:Glycoprotein Xg isoform X9 n=1 Tax=Acinonyx jubatus TaxID=32536 RepID=A0ABM3NEY2_ACIJB|nr:glycoprotein Xg isoform X9 [Acinonyx jubatus]
MPPWARRLLPLLAVLANANCQPPQIAKEPGQRDFDLADALDDPEPTKKPSSDIYPRPKPPYHPQPGMPDNSGDIYPRPKPPYHPQPGMPDNSGDIYPRPKPPYHPQPGMPDNSGGIYPRPRPPPRPQPGGSDSGGAGGGGYYPNNDGHGNAYGGDGYSTYGNQQGNTIAKIVSPIVSVLVVMLVGAATGWFQRNRRRNCFRTREPEHV